jgi:transcriptional regulator with XRE-family HTH domain
MVIKEKIGDITRAELAKTAKLTATYISPLLKGDHKNPSLDELKRLARALGVPVTELLE